MIYVPRLTIPEKGNPYYNRKASGGYSSAITGKPTCEGLDVLSNCSGYAVGRFSEACGDTTMHYLKPVNAENFIDYADKSLKVGTVPKLGACAVWQKGQKGGSDGAGHVAIVEQLNADGTITTSESGWNCKTPFWTKVRKDDGNWGQASTYTFLGFIYQPIDFEPEPSPSVVTFEPTDVKKGCRGDYVKQVQVILKGLGLYSDKVDGIAGNNTRNGIIAFQKLYKLDQDGVFNAKCWKAWLNIN